MTTSVKYIIKFTYVKEERFNSYYSRCASGNSLGFSLEHATKNGSFKSKSHALKVLDKLNSEIALIGNKLDLIEI